MTALPEYQRPSPISVGLTWASRVTSIGMSFVLPTLAGYGVDRWLGSSPIGTLVGALLGFLVGMLQILGLAKQVAARQPSRPDKFSGTD